MAFSAMIYFMEKKESAITVEPVYCEECDADVCQNTERKATVSAFKVDVEPERPL